jgi:hypothetical protein
VDRCSIRLSVWRVSEAKTVATYGSARRAACRDTFDEIYLEQTAWCLALQAQLSTSWLLTA